MLLFWLRVNHFCLICVHLLLVYHSAQFSYTWSDFTCLLRVMTWKVEFCFTSFWYYYHRLWWSSWHAMLALFLSYVYLVWIFSSHDLLQVTGTDTSCVLYKICSQFIAFEQVTLCSAWFVALLASPYVVLLCTNLFVFGSIW